MACNNSVPRGREPSLTAAQRLVMWELRQKGTTIESLAVGFSVSYNTVRNVLRDMEAQTSPLVPTGPTTTEKTDRHE